MSLPSFAPLHRFASRRRMSTTLPRTLPASPPAPLPTIPPQHNYLPFSFGAEFELVLRPKDGASLRPGVELPDFDASTRARRDFNLKLLDIISVHLTDNDLACEVYDPNEEGAKPNYAKWHVTLDASVSKKHMADGFYPVEIVTRVIEAKAEWDAEVMTFWNLLDDQFVLRQDTSCGMHIHISSCEKRFRLFELKSIAKAIVLWERETALCAPPSRDDKAQSFCHSNLKGGAPVARQFEAAGPVMGQGHAIASIDAAKGCDEVVDYLCLDKHRSWNLLPSRAKGHGTVEFRRPPGVVSAVEALHWIAFTMAFVNLALTTDLKDVQQRKRRDYEHRRYSEFAFADLLLESAHELGLSALVEADLRKQDNPATLHITTMRNDQLDWLQSLNPAYQRSSNA